jgi:hypothetical protein
VEGTAVKQRSEDGSMEYVVVGLVAGRIPDLVRLRGRDWCPSIYREPDEAPEAYWARVMAVARTLRAESLDSRPAPDEKAFQFIMACSYGVNYIDPDRALDLDLLDATKWRLRRLMDNPDSSPEVQVQAAIALAGLLVTDLR